MGTNRRRYGASLDQPRTDKPIGERSTVGAPPQVQPRRTIEATRVVGASGAVVTGDQTITGTLTVTGAVTLSSTLGVTGAVILSSTLSSGAITTSGKLLITHDNGLHIQAPTLGKSRVVFRSNSVQHGLISETGAYKGTNAVDIGIFAETGLGIEFAVNGSATSVLTLASTGVITTTDDFTINSLGTFDSSDTPLDREVLQYSSSTSKWQSQTILKPVADGDVLAQAYTDGTASSHVDTLAGTYSGDPSTGTVAVPVLTPIYKGFQVDVSDSSALPANTVYSIEWSSDSGSTWSGASSDYIRSDGQQVVHSKLAIDGTTYRYRVSIHGTGGTDVGPSTETSDVAPLNTPEVFTQGIVLASQISTVDLASLSADFGTVTISASGSLSSGQTDYNTGTGFWLEANSGTPRFSLGIASGNGLTWDGSALTVTGIVHAKGSGWFETNLKVGDTNTSADDILLHLQNLSNAIILGVADAGYGVRCDPQYTMSGSTTEPHSGLFGGGITGGSHNIATLTGLETTFSVTGTGVIANDYGVRIQAGTRGSTSTTTRYGVKVESLTNATTNYAIHTSSGLSSFGDDIEQRGATETMVLKDAGSTSATEQDWIEVTVGGNTGYVRVFASK